MGYLRRMKRENKLGSRGETCLTRGIAQNHPRRTFRVLNDNTGETSIRQNVSWHPETLEVQGDGDEATVSGRATSTGVKQMPQPSPDVNIKVTTAMPPITQQPERTMEPAEGPL